MAYRLLKKVGYMPKEVSLLREIQDVQTVIRAWIEPDRENPLQRCLIILLQRLRG